MTSTATSPTRIHPQVHAALLRWRAEVTFLMTPTDTVLDDGYVETAVAQKRCSRCTASVRNREGFRHRCFPRLKICRPQVWWCQRGKSQFRLRSLLPCPPGGGHQLMSLLTPHLRQVTAWWLILDSQMLYLTTKSGQPCLPASAEEGGPSSGSSSLESRSSPQPSQKKDG